MNRETRHLSIGIALLTVTLSGSAPFSFQTESLNAAEKAAQPLNLHFKDLKWERIVPELGERSPEMAILRVDPVTQATQLMIRVPKNTHVPKHWHSGNETHTVLSGTFIVECEGKRAALGPRSFNYIPSKMPHEAWTKTNEGTLLFVTVDKGWDVNWVGAPPKPQDFSPGLSK
jgi:quercetin dioxygenase-like cupin family protein